MTQDPHAHDHDHDHAHTHGADDFLAEMFDGDRPPSDFEVLEIALRELLFEKGVITPAELKEKIVEWDAKTPAIGARIVARAWVDPAFKARLKQDFIETVAELGIDARGPDIVALENTPTLHHVVCCTLCSCYPRAVLGMPPDWYKGREYRARVVVEPRAVLGDFGTVLPESVEVRVVDNTAENRYLVLPLRPQGTEGMSEADLAALVTRDSMIGVGLAKRPQG
ncbi:MAG: nitrile hydratase subunit alpha [Alphaproteobacteria bacterium]|nr:nitrile hydratase subunit alpha [Alphaproteobacteria bacterium]